MNDYRTAVDNTYYYEKDARPQYDVGSNVYPNRKHDWERNNAVIVNSSPPQRKIKDILKNKSKSYYIFKWFT